MFAFLIGISRSVFDLSDRLWDWMSTPIVDALGESDALVWLLNAIGIPRNAPLISVMIGTGLIGILIYSLVKWVVGIVTGS